MNPIFPPPPPLKKNFFPSGPYLSRGGLFLKTVFTILTSSILGLCWFCFCCGLSDCCLVFDKTCMAVGLVFVDTCVAVGLLWIVKCVTIGLVFVDTCDSWLGVCWVIRDSWPGVAVTCMAAGLVAVPSVVLAFVHYSPYKLDKTKLYCYLAFSSFPDITNRKTSRQGSPR